VKKYIVGGLLVLLSCSNAIAANDAKIGFVSVERILTEAPQVAAVNSQMEQRFGSKKQELLDLESEIKTMQENYKRNELVMTEDKLNELKNNIIGKVQAFKQKEAVLTQEVSTMRSQELAVLQQSIRSIIQDIAKTGKYDLVLSEGVVFASEKLDITDQVLDKMKKAFEESKK